MSASTRSRVAAEALGHLPENGMDEHELTHDILVAMMRLVITNDTVDLPNACAWREVRVKRREVADALAERLVACAGDSGPIAVKGVDTRPDGDDWIVRISIKVQGPLAEIMREIGGMES